MINILFWVGISMMGLFVFFQVIRFYFHLKYHIVASAKGIDKYRIRFIRINSILWTITFRKYIYFSNVNEATRITELAKLNGRF